TYGEIYNLMDEISQGRLDEVLTTYFVASSFKEGFSAEELYHFTKAMVETGTKLKFEGVVADKHSIGGLAGTRTTMIIVPIIAAAGFKIPKTSSRAITTPAGTADVMELIADIDFTPQQAEHIVNKTGGCIVWNGKLGLAPADDIIIKVEAPLMFESFDKIIISIMAKKIAVSTNHLILDIPVGKTMKVKHFSDAEKVAQKFIQLGKHFGMRVIADISEGLEPGGRGVGPYLEAKDVMSVLEQKADRPLKLEEKSIRLASKLLDLCYQESHTDKNGEEEALKILKSGLALKKFQEIVKAQGGKSEITYESLKSPAHKKIVHGKKSGKVKEINNYNLNTLAKLLGAPKDKYAGIYLLKKLDDVIKKDEPVLEFYSCDTYKLKETEITLENFPIYQVE
ncbi:MAG: thymidine phosphorylase, partial [Patescibacteria group bacterium]